MLTPTVQGHLRNLARAVLLRRYPILLQVSRGLGRGRLPAWLAATGGASACPRVCSVAQTALQSSTRALLASRVPFNAGSDQQRQDEPGVLPGRPNGAHLCAHQQPRADRPAGGCLGGWAPACPTLGASRASTRRLARWPLSTHACCLPAPPCPCPERAGVETFSAVGALPCLPMAPLGSATSPHPPSCHPQSGRPCTPHRSTWGRM